MPFSNVKTYAKGSVVIKAGTGPGSPRDMIFILQGNIGVYRDHGMTNERQVQVIGNGDFYGESALFLNRDHTETLIALTDVVAFLITRRNVGEFFATQPDMTGTLIEGLCGRLAEAYAEISKLRRSDNVDAASAQSSLFPEGHASYLLPLDNASDNVYTTTVKCPLCQYSFENVMVIVAKLRLEKTEPSLRARYRGIEPLYYEIITCPNCLFSASTDAFQEASKRLASSMNQKTGPYRLEIKVSAGRERDTFTVFAGYYLALLCAPIISENPSLATASLWMKLDRIYQDAGDMKMADYAAAKAFADYQYAYENIHMSEKGSQQLCYLMGDLAMRVADIDTARNYFFLCKSNKAAGSNVMVMQADRRLEEIRVMKKADG
ncbi:MAG: DUF2225 domain-containing protein [Oscillospiraceae bacterium]|nr:DUF2225 domain-containing protein [Oscillospiraceae bacterium]